MSMYRDSFTPDDDHPGVRLMRALSSSGRVGTFFGVELRVYWIAAIITPLLFWLSTGDLILGVIWAAFLFVIIFTHEMGHIVAGWRFRIRTPLITLSPLGGTAHASAPFPHPRAETVVALAGPATHLIWLALLVIPWFLLRATPGYVSWTVQYLWSVNLTLMVFNLLPCFPMDGGRVLRSLLAQRMHPNKATLRACQVGQIGAILLGLVGLVTFFSGSYWGGILMAIAFSNYGACQMELLAARYQDTPYGGGELLAAWQQDPDAWKHGDEMSSMGTDTGGGRLLDGWRQRRDDAKRKREADAAAAQRRELDRILERVSEIGMDGITPEERKFLLKISKERRGG